MKETFNRRDFLKKASIATVAGSTGLLVGCSIGQPDAEGSATESENQAAESSQATTAPNINTNQVQRWSIVTTWPPTLPIIMDGIRLWAEEVRVMSGGRLEIEVFGGGELVPALESFDAVDAGTAQLGHGASYYWAGKTPASQFFTSVPFGMNAQQMYAWIYGAGGLELWEETYADFNLVPIPMGNTGVQMGGWFNKEINTLDDYNGLKMRMPGLGGRVVSEVGGSAELIAGGEIYTSLERGVIDATEWIGPAHDETLGFNNVAQYYYYPGWHEPGSVLELLVNRSAWEELPEDLKMIVRVAADKQNTWMLANFDAQNGAALDRLVAGGVDLREFPAEVMNGLREAAQDVLSDVAANDPQAGKVYESFSAFQQEVGGWGGVSERSYYNLIQDPSL